MGVLVAAGVAVAMSVYDVHSGAASAEQPASVPVGLPQAQTAWPSPGVSSAATMPVPGERSDEVIAFSYPAGEGRQQVTVIDPKSLRLAVYHVEVATGQVSLKSVRSIAWDLQIEEFNSASPLPREIRSLVDHDQR